MGINNLNGRNTDAGITDSKIAEVAGSIMSFCLSRTSNQHDAEDLSQEIFLELVKALPNLRDEKAFYGFMWAVAGNVYKQWCIKRSKSVDEFELMPGYDRPDERIRFTDSGNPDISLLRRELGLLNEKSRKAMILYYFEKKSCSEISTLLNISESMVKHLLFKSRKQIKDGMSMERTLGEQSFNPKKIQIANWSKNNPKPYWAINDNLIQQNIIMACYNDLLNVEEISLQIGVPFPYMEKDINKLIALNVLQKKGSKYATNIIIATSHLRKEI